MGSAAPHGRQTRWTRRARFIRWIGLDGNPMRRRTDRIEAVSRLVIVFLLVAMVPVAAIAAGRAADRLALREARAQQSTYHLVTAVLTQKAPETAISDPYVAVDVTWAAARWTAPDGTAHTGMVLAALGAPKGSVVRSWIDASGHVTGPPASHADVIGAVFTAVALAALGVTVVLLAAHMLLRQALERRRLSAWDAEWRATGPRWTSHRP